MSCGTEMIASLLGSMLTICLPLQMERGLVVIAYADGTPADVHILKHDQCLHYWGAWLHRLHRYWDITLRQHNAAETAG